jgi:hypothetical protein
MENENNQTNDWKEREIGALWRRSGKSQKYLSGYIRTGDELDPQEVRLVVFSNKYKSENEKAPDFVVYRSEPAQKQETVEAKSSNKAPAKAEEDDLEQELEELLK